MAFSIGFHGGPGGNHNGLGDYYRQLDAAHIPFFVKSTDHYGHCFEAAAIARASGVPHVIVYRLTRYGQNDGLNYDVPPYDMTPRDAAIYHWTITKNKLPPEFDKELVWVEPINEIDKGRSDWLGHFAAELGTLAMADGYKVTLFGWSSGEPEPEHWHTAGMKRYLTMCAQHPTRLAVSLHEYSYTLDDIKDQFPFKVGRFQALFAACDQMGIGRPTVHLTEWGWTHEEVPEPSKAMADLDWAYRLYAPYEQVKGAGIWGLLGGFGGIANLAQPLIGPVTEYMKNTPAVEPDPGPNPGPNPGETADQFLWRQSEEYAAVHGVDYSDGLGLHKELTARGNRIQHRELPVHFEGRDYAIQGGIDSQGKKTLGIWTSGQPLRFIQSAGEPPPPTAFAATAWPLNDLRLTQWFAANPQNYQQFELPGHDGSDHRAPTGTEIRALAAGQVYLVVNDEGQGGNYGIQVRIDHGNGHKTVYAHLLSTRVTPIQQVQTGQLIGLADNTGNSQGSHLHVTYKRDGLQYTDPAGNVWPHNLFDPWLILRPLFESYLSMAGVAGYVWASSTRKHPHFDYGFGITNLNLRQQPDSNSPILGLVGAGVPFRITGPKTNSGYYPAVALLSHIPPGTVQPNEIDMAAYFLPISGNYGPIHILTNNWGQDPERTQLQRDGDYGFVTKNQQYERRKVTPQMIYFDLDTSPGDGQFYRVQGQGWLPRRWSPGNTFRRVERVFFYQKSNCQPVPDKPPYDSVNTIHFRALHPTWVSKAGIVLSNVVELHWEVNGVIEERYWYAPGMGLVAWKKADQKESWISELIPVGQQDNNVRETGCF